MRASPGENQGKAFFSKGDQYIEAPFGKEVPLDKISSNEVASENASPIENDLPRQDGCTTAFYGSFLDENFILSEDPHKSPAYKLSPASINSPVYLIGHGDESSYSNHRNSDLKGYPHGGVKPYAKAGASDGNNDIIFVCSIPRPPPPPASPPANNDPANRAISSTS
ncbi:hypothetical protein MKZ38_009954 [Zalerion maritima]|uniref:Uncharacterized protein n=1 Tax=Zalerion maritima TaxID=339359 RepID=A0AAD5RGV2_9PEZI|nr:hypothetical protein MKZ38_009954 [Zalerion maritima]